MTERMRRGLPLTPVLFPPIFTRPAKLASRHTGEGRYPEYLPKLVVAHLDTGVRRCDEFGATLKAEAVGNHRHHPMKPTP